MKEDIDLLKTRALELLKKLISIPSFSSEEDKTADAIEAWFKSYDIPFQAKKKQCVCFQQVF